MAAETRPSPATPGTILPAIWMSSAGRGPLGRELTDVELWYLAHPTGACLEVFVDSALRGRISTRTAGPGGPAAPHAPPRPAARPGRTPLSRILRFDLDEPPRARRAPSRAPRRARRYFEARRVRLRPGKHRIELRAVGTGTVRLFGAVLRRDRPGVVLHTLGVPGAQVANVAPGHKGLLRAQLARLRPTLLITLLGTNDAYDHRLTAKALETRLTTVLRELRGGDTRPDCLLVGTPDFSDKHWRKARRLRQKAAMTRRIQRKVAAAQGCAYWDLYAAMGGAGSIQRLIRAHPPLAYGDRIHLTRRGYRALGGLLYDALMAEYARYLAARPLLKVSLPTRPVKERREERDARRRWPTGMGPVPLVDPKGTALHRFFRALVLLARKGPRARARIVFVGDSHVAGDQLSGELRFRLQRSFGDAGHGYLHAGAPWTGYNHRNVRGGATGPWHYYYLRTARQPDQPSDRLFGLGGVSTWITLPLPPAPPAGTLP
ncbi:MAG: GDSL-type esterase/lipase family protein [bacterium]